MNELKLTNKRFAEELVAHLNESKNKAKLEEKDGKFIVTYEASAVSPEGPSVEEKMSNMMNWMASRMDKICSSIYAEIDSLYASHSTHKQGHLPPFSPSAMNKVLKIAGMQDDYKAEPRTIYASTSVEFGAEELRNALNKLQAQDDKPADPEISKLLDVIKEQQKK